MQPQNRWPTTEYIFFRLYNTQPAVSTGNGHLSRHVFHRFRRLSKPFLIGKSFCPDQSTLIPFARLAVVGSPSQACPSVSVIVCVTEGLVLPPAVPAAMQFQARPDDSSISSGSLTLFNSRRSSYAVVASVQGERKKQLRRRDFSHTLSRHEFCSLVLYPLFPYGRDEQRVEIHLRKDCKTNSSGRQTCLADCVNQDNSCVNQDNSRPKRCANSTSQQLKPIEEIRHENDHRGSIH